MADSWGRRFSRALVLVLVPTIASLIAVSAAAAMSGRRPMAMPGIPAGAMQHMEHPTKAAWIAFSQPLHPHGWTVTASSFATGHPASAVLGSRRSAYWRSARLGSDTQLPQSITIRFPSSRLVSGLMYVPHARVGEIGRFRVTLSRDGSRFGAAVAYGRWQANAADKKVAWMPRRVRAVRLTVLSVSPVRANSVAAARIVLTGARRGASGRNARASVDATAASTDPSVVGQWGPTIAFPLVPVAAALIPGNKLVVWSAEENFTANSVTSPYTQTAILDLTTGMVTPATVSNTAHDMFCPGVSILPDGEVMVTGGLSNAQTSIYNPATNTWRAGPQMNLGRGYQGQTTLSDGQALVLGGSWSGAIGGKLGEVWSATGGWRELTGVPADPIYTADSQGPYRADNHGWFIATSGGKVFQAGPSAQMHWITTTGAGNITSAGVRGAAGDQMNGNAVLYDVGKILTVGGAPNYQASNATAAANVVDISNGTAQVQSTSQMTYPRSFANSVALPTGKVFTVGGETYAMPWSDENSDMSPELWDPSTGQWTGMASQAEPRNYHSVAVLLPDGTVFSGGGGLCGTCATNHPDGQIFSPPYLFNPDGSPRARPTISTAPSAAGTGQTISVTTGAPVQSFVLMRYGEATHTVDNDQRRIPLTIASSSGTTYQLAIPSDPGVVLPGPYMLFAIDANGTPSVSATISISTPALSVPSHSYGKTVDSTGPAVYWPLADSDGSTGAADLSGNRDTGAFSSAGITYQTPSPVEGPRGQGVTLNGGQIISTQPQATPSAFSEELWFKTTSSSGGALMRFGDSPTGADTDTDRVLYMTNSGQLVLGTKTGVQNVVSSPLSYNDGDWHFVVATQGADGMHLYADGIQVASNSVADAQSYTGYWQLGGAPTGWPDQPSGAFSGSISDAAMYLSELTPAQVQTAHLSSPLLGGPDTTTVEVGQGGDTFTQADVTIDPGETIDWHWDSGPHSVTSGAPPGTPNNQFDSAVQTTSGATFDQTFNHPGVYHYFCRIHYASGMVGTITVTGTDPAPTAAFTAPASVTAGQQVTFDASTSSTSDGDTIQGYTWNFGDGTAPRTTFAPTTTHAFASTGAPNVTLTITDAGSATSAPVAHALDVKPPPDTAPPDTAPPDTAPTAHFSFLPKIPRAGQTVAFDGSGSSDGDGDAISSYHWDFGDGLTQTTATPKTSHRYTRAGPFSVTLAVVDSQGTPSAPASSTLSIQWPPPVVSNLHLSKTDFCVKNSRTCRRPGTHVDFRLSRAAEVTLLVRRRGAIVRRFSRAGKAGANSWLLSGKGLAAGRCSLILTPAGGTAAGTSFTVARS